MSEDSATAASSCGTARPVQRGMVIGVPGSYWEIEYEGEIYPWRPVHPGDERDMPHLMRTAVAYLQAELQRRP
jgi:hypothetical protein